MHSMRPIRFTPAFVTALLVGVVVAAAIASAAASAPSPLPAAASDRPEPRRDVMLVGNNHAGILEIVEARRPFRILHRIDVAPDFDGCLSGPSSAAQSVGCTLNNELAAEGEPQLVDDIATSPDGRTVYISRPSMGDVAAFDLATGEMLDGWPVAVSGFVGPPPDRELLGRRSDHMAISPDGSQLLVSATVANVVDVIDTERAEIVDGIETGDFPHENRYTDDGSLIFDGTIGRVITPDDERLDAAKGERVLTIADAETLEVIKRIDFGEEFGRNAGIRPFVVMPDNRTMYIQLSFFPGIVEYDVEEERALRTVKLPLRGRDPVEDDFLDSAHHGLAISGDRTRLCAAGTISDYAAIVDRETLTVRDLIETGEDSLPYWAWTTPNGRLCFVANARDDSVSVISYRRAAEVARIEVGTGSERGDDFPQRIRSASLPSDVLAAAGS